MAGIEHELSNKYGRGTAWDRDDHEGDMSLREIWV